MPNLLKHDRKLIDNGGRLEIVQNQPNNNTMDNQYAKLVDQKAND